MQKLRRCPLTLPSPARGEGKDLKIQEEIPSPLRGEGRVGVKELRDVARAPLTLTLSPKRLCRNEKKEPSFPRKRESSRDFIQDLSPLDARLRGHDEF